MDKIVLQGGVPLRGTVTISGAKNSALPLLFLTLICPGAHRLTNLPALRDINTALNLLKGMGAVVEQNGDEAVIDTTELTSIEAPYDLVKTMRASVLVLGPLLARVGKARVSLPGGCAIGARPVDQHLKGFEALGAIIDLDHGYIDAQVGADGDGLKGGHVYFDMPTVGGTENLLMAAALAEGETLIENAAREPEIVELADALNSMGARITGAGTDTIRVTGVNRLHPLDYRVMPDRIEAGTYMVAAAVTGGDIELCGIRTDHLEAVIRKLEEAGAEVTTSDDCVRVRREGVLKPIKIQTSPHPGFPTDMQAQFMALLCFADGTSTISEHVFENRFMHVCELQRMGAKISIQGHVASVEGADCLEGAPVMATDLRASASLILAGLASSNTTEISRIYHLDRGYERIEEKLRALGARIERVPA